MQVGKKHEHDMGDSEAHSKRIDYGIGNLVDYQADSTFVNDVRDKVTQSDADDG